MTSGFEAVGDMATGALIAGAVEPGDGAAHGQRHERCANCGADLAGPYCHACGQKGHIHRSLMGFVHDLLHGVFHFDGKFWATLPLLFWRPGELTRRYIHGERAKFVSPLALFLFCVFVTFAVLGNMSFDEGSSVVVNNQLSIAEMEREIAQGRAAEQDLLRQIRAAVVAGESPRALEKAWEQARVERHGYEHARDDKLRALGLPMRPGHPEVVVDRTLDETAIEARIKRDKDAERALARRIRDEARAGRDIRALERQLEQARDDAQAYQRLRKAKMGAVGRQAPDDNGGNTPWPLLNEGIAKAKENPGLFLYRLQSSAYKYSWTLIPISTPLVWLLFFWKRQYKAYDHLVFVTFSLSFMLLLVTALALASMLGLSEGWYVSLLMILAPLHMYRQLRGAYLIGRASAALRTAVLSGLAAFALLLYLIGLLALGVLH